MGRSSMLRGVRGRRGRGAGADAPATSPPVAPSGACAAAHAALYLRPDGGVQACCATGYELGYVGDADGTTLTDIWNGARRRAHADRLDEGRFDFGCQECELAIATGGRPASLAWHFDRWADPEPPSHPKLLDLALSNRCNLECVMCNGDLSSSIRKRREGRPPLRSPYGDAFFEELADFLPHTERLQFKGGEPFLAPENRRVWDLLLESGHRPEIAVTTNGTVLNEQVERYVVDLGMAVNLSVDGVTPGVVEGIRLGATTDGLWASVDRFAELGRTTGQGLTLSFCLLRSNWTELPLFLAEADRRGVNGNVIFVNQPHEFDLLRLPADGLREVVAGLEAATPRDLTEGSRVEWERVLGRIRAQIEDPVVVHVHVMAGARPAAIPVELSARPVTEQRVLDDALAWSPEPPLVAEIVGGAIATVDAPAWAAELEPDRWIGRHHRSMPELLEEIVGVAPSVDVAPSELFGVDDVRIDFGGASGLPELRVLTWAAPDVDGPIRWYVSRRPG